VYISLCDLNRKNLTYTAVIHMDEPSMSPEGSYSSDVVLDCMGWPRLCSARPNPASEKDLSDTIVPNEKYDHVATG
jgi:hypothetical protein